MASGKIGSYISAVACGIILLAAAVLVVLQWGNRSSFSLFGKNYGENPSGGVNTGLLMILCVAAGPLLLILVKTMVRSALAIRRDRKQEHKPAGPST